MFNRKIITAITAAAITASGVGAATSAQAAPAPIQARVATAATKAATPTVASTLKAYKTAAFGSYTKTAAKASIKTTDAQFAKRLAYLQRQDRGLRRQAQTAKVKKARANINKSIRSMQAAQVSYRKAVQAAKKTPAKTTTKKPSTGGVMLNKGAAFVAPTSATVTAIRCRALRDEERDTTQSDQTDIGGLHRGNQLNYTIEFDLTLNEGTYAYYDYMRSNIEGRVYGKKHTYTHNMYVIRNADGHIHSDDTSTLSSLAVQAPDGDASTMHVLTPMPSKAGLAVGDRMPISTDSSAGNRDITVDSSINLDALCS